MIRTARTHTALRTCLSLFVALRHKHDTLPSKLHLYLHDSVFRHGELLNIYTTLYVYLHLSTMLFYMRILFRNEEF